MNCMKSFCSTPLRHNDVVERCLDIKLQRKEARYYLKWGAINLIITAILLADIHAQCCQGQSNKYIYHYLEEYWYWMYCIECLILLVTSLSTIACSVKYIIHVYCTEPLEGTKYQKSLLQFDDNDNSFMVATSKKSNTNKGENADMQEVPLNITKLSWQSSFNESRGFSSPNWSFNRSSSKPSSIKTQHQQHQHRFNTSENSMLNVSNKSNNTTPFLSSYYQHIQEPITDKKGLQKYLQNMSRKENTVADLLDTNQNFNRSSMNSFWNYCNSTANILKTSLYQLSPLPVASSQTNFKESGGICIMDSNSEIIKRISSEKLSRYVGNLRTWMSATILKRLSKEISTIDESFKHRGFHDMRIGSIGLERLKKTVENQQFVNQYMPMLPLIVPFLEMSSNQEYLVKRIKDLAQGSCISDYRWDSGSEYHGLKWDEHLPTDSAILFHLFCVYFDTQLMPLPQGGGRPFYNRYVIMGDDKRSTSDTVALVKNRAKCAILCTNPIKPKFNFISDSEIHNCAYDRNNLFYVIIQFLIYMRTRHESCLEGVNLGKSGINIMCVIEE